MFHRSCSTFVSLVVTLCDSCDNLRRCSTLLSARQRIAALFWSGCSDYFCLFVFFVCVDRCDTYSIWFIRKLIAHEIIITRLVYSHTNILSRIYAHPKRIHIRAITVELIHHHMLPTIRYHSGTARKTNIHSMSVPIMIIRSITKRNLSGNLSKLHDYGWVRFVRICALAGLAWP